MPRLPAVATGLIAAAEIGREPRDGSAMVDGR